MAVNDKWLDELIAQLTIAESAMKAGIVKYERLKAACERMMIGGNHIATYRTDAWPAYGSDPLSALEKLGAGREYDMWCCWSAIMSARDSLESL